MAFRVMVVDDSAVLREVVRECLSSNPNLEVVATAANGRQALERLEKLAVDAVVLDVEMPEMDGLETLLRIRRDHRHVRVIMFSGLTRDGASITLEALTRGADDYLTKPSGANFEHSISLLRERLIPKLEALREASPSKTSAQTVQRTPAGSATTAERVPPGTAVKPIELLAIGASTGGPNALAELLGMLPPNLPIPVVIVQHMPPLFTQLLAERLGIRTGWKVTEATEGQVLEAGHAVVAPGDFHLEITRQHERLVCHLSQSAPIHSVRPAVDLTFRTAADATRGHLLGIVLTGMGHDGRSGSEFIVRAGGTILVQDEASSVVWGMPGSVYRAGWASGAHSLESLAKLTQQRLNFESKKDRSRD